MVEEKKVGFWHGFPDMGHAAIAFSLTLPATALVSIGIGFCSGSFALQRKHAEEVISLSSQIRSEYDFNGDGKMEFGESSSLFEDLGCKHPSKDFKFRFRPGNYEDQAVRVYFNNEAFPRYEVSKSTLRGLIRRPQER